MPRQSQNWTQLQRERLRASPAIQYVLQVTDGSVQIESRADENRLACCWRVIDKLIPTPKAVDVAMSGDLTVRWKS